jgi:hypothetical protein
MIQAQAILESNHFEWIATVLVSIITVIAGSWCAWMTKTITRIDDRLRRMEIKSGVNNNEVA